MRIISGDTTACLLRGLIAMRTISGDTTACLLRGALTMKAIDSGTAMTFTLTIVRAVSRLAFGEWVAANHTGGGGSGVKACLRGRNGKTEIIENRAYDVSIY